MSVDSRNESPKKSTRKMSQLGSQDSQNVSVEIPEGMKLDKETGEIVPMTEDELRLKKLLEEIEMQEDRLNKLEGSWKMYNETEVSDDEKWEVSSNDSMLAHSTTLAGNSVSKG